MICVSYIVEYRLKPVPCHEIVQPKRCTFKNINMFVGPKPRQSDPSTVDIRIHRPIHLNNSP